MYLLEKNAVIFLEVVFFVHTVFKLCNLGRLLMINSVTSFSWASSFYFVITAKKINNTPK